ncbi:hypothetical protein ACFR97_10280 [Haloplanus litoreus]|uniref:Uncharacterized protein n=1 Tax=Haloplanus litoreus TaxID=767515 RepID=A0ABD5ZTW7_9EURY
MPTQPHPILEIDADFGGSLGQQTGRFEFRKATVEETVRTGYLVDSALSDVIGLLSEYLPTDDGARKGITIDAGGGQHVFEVDITSLGAEDGQWGYSNDETVLDQATATGGDRVQKMHVLMRYLTIGSVDSFTPARLIYGEYAPGGVMPQDHLPVFLEDPNILADRETATSFDGSITFVETTALDQTLSGTQQTPD